MPDDSRLSGELAAASLLPADERASAVGRLLGEAASTLPAAALLALIQRHRRARCFCRASFAAAAVPEGGSASLSLGLAWELSKAGALLFAQEYLSRLSTAQGFEAAARELLQLAADASEQAADAATVRRLSSLFTELVCAAHSSSEADEAAATAARETLAAADRLALDSPPAGQAWTALLHLADPSSAPPRSRASVTACAAPFARSGCGDGSHSSSGLGRSEATSPAE